MAARSATLSKVPAITMIPDLLDFSRDVFRSVTPGLLAKAPPIREATAPRHSWLFLGSTDLGVDEKYVLASLQLVEETIERLENLDDRMAAESVLVDIESGPYGEGDRWEVVTRRVVNYDVRQVAPYLEDDFEIWTQRPLTEIPNWCASPSTTDLQQGDILADFPMLTPKISEGGEPVLARSVMTCALLTQTCDIAKPSHEWLLLGQVYPYSDLASRMQHLKRTEYKKSLVDGIAIADFLIPPSPPRLPEWMILHFRNVFSLPKAYVVQNAADRLELISPYREHLAQAFARFLMRVGLPSGLQGYIADIQQLAAGIENAALSRTIGAQRIGIMLAGSGANFARSAKPVHTQRVRASVRHGYGA